MNILTKLSIALTGKAPFKLGWKRLTHIERGHPYSKSIRLETLVSNFHPHNTEDYKFAVNIMKCQDCGLIWLDSGLASEKTSCSANQTH